MQKEKLSMKMKSRDSNIKDVLETCYKIVCDFLRSNYDVLFYFVKEKSTPLIPNNFVGRNVSHQFIFLLFSFNLNGIFFRLLWMDG
jgi:hypothetical protein